MKILYIITKANWGGAQKYVFDLAKASKAQGHAVLVVYGETGVLVEKLTEANVPVLAVPEMQNRASLGALKRALCALTYVFEEEQPDIVHLNSSLAGVAGAQAAQEAGVPCIIFTAHGWAFNEDRSLLQRLALLYLSWRTVIRSTKTICVSNAIARAISWLPGVRKKLTIIHNGVTCANLLSREEARNFLLPGKEGCTWIGMISELHSTKGVDDALSAMRLLVQENPNLILVVCGEGVERERLEKEIHTLNLSSKVFLLGFIKDAATYARAFDIFLHSARSEALGYAILEAGCASLPVVATNVGGIPEIISNEAYGTLVPPHNPPALAEALSSLLESKEQRETLGNALHTRVARSFSKETMLEATLSLYKE